MRKPDQISAVIILGLGVYVGLEGWRLAYWADPEVHVPGPGFLPFWLGVGLVVGGVGILLETHWTPLGSQPWFPSRDALVRVVVLIFLMGLLTLAMNSLGMLLALGLYLLVFLAIYTPGRWLLILLMAVGTPVTVHLVFERWLKVPLLQGFLGF